MRHRVTLFASLLILAAGVGASGLAQPTTEGPVRRVADINVTDSWGTDLTLPSVMEAVQLGDVAFLPVNDGIHGQELWRTDGTPGGSWIVSDVFPGLRSAEIIDLVELNGLLLFAADDGVHGRELWASDGTDDGTRLVIDLLPGPGGSSPAWLVPVGDRVFFAADDGTHGRELWVSDGSTAGTRLVADLVQGSAGSDPRSWMGLGEQLVFSAETPEHGREPWVSDGSAAGTVGLGDLNPGTAGSISFYPVRIFPFFVARLGDWVYFSARTETAGTELWRTDGTALATEMVVDLGPGEQSSVPGGLTPYRDHLYFRAGSTEHGSELWRTDGTAPGTTLLADIEPGVNSSFLSAITPLDETLVFVAIRSDVGRELWRIDAEGGPPTLLADTVPGPESGFFFFSPHRLAALDDYLVMPVRDADDAIQLWRTDGTIDGTVPIGFPGTEEEQHFSLDGFSGFVRPTVLAGRWLFRLFTRRHGHELYLSDGTAEGTELLELNAQTSAVRILDKAFIRPMAAVGSALYAGATDLLAEGSELWSLTDGSPPQVLTDFAPPAPYAALVYPIGPAGSHLLFETCCEEGPTIWASDGTPEGTVPLVPDRVSGAQIVPAGELAFLAASNHLWITDGTPDGTTELVLLSAIDDLTPLDDGVLFTARTGRGVGTDLWRSDGTVRGTQLVTTIASGSEAEVSRMAPVGEAVAFSVSAPGGGAELWASDGTTEGTLELETLYGSVPRLLSPFPEEAAGETHATTGAAYWFVADDGTHGAELWLWDGDGPPHLARDVVPGTGSSHPRWLTACSERLFFVADDGVTGRELWVSDGSSDGTLLVADIAPGAESSVPQSLACVDGLLFFSATDRVHGLEPWVSDGTPAGTYLLQDVAPGPTPSSATRFTDVENRIAMIANDGTTGFEVWEVDKTDVIPADLGIALEAPTTGTTSGTVPVALAVTNGGRGAAAEVEVTLGWPSTLGLVAASPPDGWSCDAATAVGVTCSTPLLDPAAVDLTITLGLAEDLAPGTSLPLTATVGSTTPEGAPGDETATATVLARSPASLEVEKTVLGTPHRGDELLYRLEVVNRGPARQHDNPGPEITDALPPQLELVAVSASTGIAAPSLDGLGFDWSGTLGAGETATIELATRVVAGTVGDAIVNQAVARYDENGDGVNDAERLSDDPRTPEQSDLTVAIVAPEAPEIPALSPTGLAVLLLLLLLAGLKVIIPRRGIR